MATLTPSLDGLILVATVYPAGFSNSLYAIRYRVPDRVSTLLLGFLALPFLIVMPALWSIHVGLSSFHAAAPSIVAIAAFLALLALGIEFAIHALVAYRKSGRFPLRGSVHPFWSPKLSALDHLLLLLIAMGEELFYRVIWLDLLQRAFGLPVAIALIISSLAYGVNHFAFGATTVASKSVVGLLYGGLYLLGGHSVWPPFVAHALQNFTLLTLERRRHG